MHVCAPYLMVGLQGDIYMLPCKYADIHARSRPRLCAWQIRISLGSSEDKSDERFCEAPDLKPVRRECKTRKECVSSDCWYDAVSTYCKCGGSRTAAMLAMSLMLLVQLCTLHAQASVMVSFLHFCNPIYVHTEIYLRIYKSITYMNNTLNYKIKKWLS